MNYQAMTPSKACLASLILLAFANPTFGKDWFKSLTDGSLDPTNRNNSLGVHIQTPTINPFRQNNNNASGLAVMSTSVDKDGNVLESSRSDRPMSATGQHAALRNDPNTGRAYWLWQGQKYIADHKYDNPAFPGQIAKQKALDNARKEDQRKRDSAIANLKGIEATISNTPSQQLAQDIGRLSNQDLENLVVRFSTFTQQAQSLGIQKTDGFQRAILFSNREMDRRFQSDLDYQRYLADRQKWQNNGNNGGNLLPPSNPPTLPNPPTPMDGGSKVYFAKNLGIKYTLVKLKNGNLGAKLVENAPNNTPAGGEDIQLERGDIIIELDDEPIQSPKDLLAHTDRTKMKIINVRTGNTTIYWVDLP